MTGKLMKSKGEEEEEIKIDDEEDLLGELIDDTELD